MTTYNKEDGPALDEISIETLLDDPSRGMNTDISIIGIFCNDQRTHSSAARTSSRRIISAEEYIARARVIRAFCPPLRVRPFSPTSV